MFRLITFFASALCLAVFVWFGLTVDLGEHTLFGHLKAISGTPEAEKLVKGARSKVTDLVGIEAAKHADRERARAAQDRTPETAPAGPPQEELEASDRQGLRKMIEHKTEPRKAETPKSVAPKSVAPKSVANAPIRKAPAPAKGRVPPPTSRPPSTP